MNTTPFWNLLKLILVLGLVCSFAPAALAQDYYPAVVGNEWVLLSSDRKQRRIYTLEKPEDVADQDLTLLKIVTQNISTGKVSGTDNYFVTAEDEGIKLHKTGLQTTYNKAKVDVLATFSTPIIFFPKVLEAGDMWEIEGDTEIVLGDIKFPGKSTTKLKIVGFESVETSVATFNACAKIEFTVSFTGPGLNLNPTTSYQWLAPNIGPVKYQTSTGNIFEIVSFKRVTPPVLNAQNPPVWNLPSNTFQVTGSRLGDILNAKILANVEDYVSEIGNLGIVAVTGSIVLPGDGTGFATNSQRKQDLWVAGNFENAPIIGTITLFAENNKGRTTETINVTINTN